MQNLVSRGWNPIWWAIGVALVTLCLAMPAGTYAADLAALVEPGRPERIATGFGFAEGPVWHPEGYLLFSDIPNSTIFKWTPAGKLEKFRNPSGKSNGLTVDQ